MSEKVEIFHFDDIANSYHGESLVLQIQLLLHYY